MARQTIGTFRAMLVRARRLAPFAALFAVLTVQACGGGDEDGAERLGAVSEEVVGPASFSISMPNNMVPQSAAVWASESLRLAPRVTVRNKSDGFGRVVNIGTGLTELGPDAKTGNVWAGRELILRPRARVEGDILAAGRLTQQPGSVVTGLARQNTPITPFRVSSWQPELPAQTLGDASLEPNRARSIPPGGYRKANIKSRSTLSLSHGTYVFDELTLEPQSKLSINDSEGPVVIYVNSAFTFRGSIVDATDEPDENVNLLVVARGCGQTKVEAPFKGTVFAPKGRLYLGPLNGGAHFGAFLGHEVDVQPGTIINHRAFPWSTLLPPSLLNWKDAPVVLKPSVGSGGDTVATGVAESTPPGPVNFTLPDTLWVSSGSAGNGLTELSYRTPSGSQIACQYRGGSPTSRPTTDLDIAKGRRYRFVSCSNGLLAGGIATGIWFKLAILSSDPQFRETVVEAHLGGGCSGSLAPPMNPEEVVVLRENFDWLTTGALAELDPTGRPALWHGLVYIERKEQLEALDRWRVKWSASPFSRTYMAPYAGQCGRVEHASDGKGVFVYAVFPAKLFNIVRNAALEAKLKNNASFRPPFTVFLPSAPDDPDYTNADGSLKYEALASSGYQEWLALRATQLPWSLSGLVSGITDTFADGAEWFDENIIDPVVDYGSDALSYVGSAWDNWVDWAAGALDDTWEWIQEGLGSIVAFAVGHVNVKLELQMASRDLNIPGRMFRTWGTPVQVGDKTGSGPSRVGLRPWITPHGVQMRIRQWGFGFLPILSQATLPKGGEPVVIEAAEGAAGRGDSQLCIELDSDAGSITTDLIPNEVCSGDVLDFAEFEHDTSNVLLTNQQDLHVMTQLVDSSDYVKTVIGHTPENADVLTGWLANTVTALLNGGPLGPFNDDERAMALCLDFPSLSQASITAVLAAVGYVTGPVGAGVAAVAGPLLMKDIWWPDVGDATNSRVATHEYGHFLMCDMLYYEDLGSALTPLIARVGEGDSDSPDDTLSIATEAWADTFAMQVLGASNYIRPHQASFGSMHYCLSASCMDYNYRGQGFYPDDPVDRQRFLQSLIEAADGDAEAGRQKLAFYEELAKTESLLHDFFDRADSLSRETNQPWNGDVLRQAPLNNEFSPTPYLAFADETVSLSGPAWRNWVTRWVATGPDVSSGGLLSALNGTAAEREHNWCERCELFALHDPVVGGAGADGDALATTATRLMRRAACISPGVSNFRDSPPEPYGNLAPNCAPCPALHFADPNNGGLCTACPFGAVPRGDHCEACDSGSVASPDNSCSSCPAYQIAVGNSCVPCRFGEGADRSSNTCQDCTPDATLDWRTVSNPSTCGAMTAELLVPLAEAPDDTCPGFTWVEINHLDTLTSQRRDELRVEAIPDKLFSGPFTGPGSLFSGLIQQVSCPNYGAHLNAYTRRAATDEPAWDLVQRSNSLGRWGRCLGEPWCDSLAGESCLWNVEVAFSDLQISAVGNRLRFRPTTNYLNPDLSSEPVPTRLLITASRPTSVDCDPQ